MGLDLRVGGGIEHLTVLRKTISDECGNVVVQVGGIGFLMSTKLHDLNITHRISILHTIIDIQGKLVIRNQ